MNRVRFDNLRRLFEGEFLHKVPEDAAATLLGHLSGSPEDRSDDLAIITAGLAAWAYLDATNHGGGE